MSASNPERAVPHRQLRALQGIYFAQTCVVVLTRVVAYAWLLQELGSRELPWVYLLQAVPLCVLTFALFGVVDRVGRASLMAVMWMLFAGGVCLAALGSGSGLHGLSPLFLLFGETAISTMGPHFWLLSSELLTPEQSKRHFPSLALVGALGAILAGGAVQLMPGLETSRLLLLLIPPAVLASGLAWCVHRWYGYRVGPRRGDVEEASWWRELTGGFSLLRGSSLLLWVGALTALVTCAGVLVDYLYLVDAERAQAASLLPAFLGSVQVTVNVLQLALVLTLGPRIFTSFGLVRTLASYPVGGLALSAGAGLSTGMWPSIGLKVFDRLENYLIMNPGVGIALGAFPKDRRGRASFVFAGLVKPVALALSGAGLLLLQDRAWLLWVLAFVAFSLILLVLRRLSGAYRDALVENLRSADTRLVANSIEALAEPEHRVVVPGLIDFLHRTDEPIFAENVLAAAGRIGDPRFVPVLLATLEGDHRSLKRAAVRSLARFPSLEVREALQKTLRDEDSARVKASILSALSSGGDLTTLRPLLLDGLSDVDPRVQANAVETIGLTQDGALLGRLRPLLEDGPPRVRANAIVALARCPAERHAALEALYRLMVSPDRGLRLSALYAAGEVREMALLPWIRERLSERDPDVHRNAAIALGKWDQIEAVAPLAAMLTAPVPAARAVALALDRLGPEVREALLERLSRSTSEERARAIDALKHCGVNYPDELEQLESLEPDPARRGAPVRLDVAPLRGIP